MRHQNSKRPNKRDLHSFCNEYKQWDGNFNWFYVWIVTVDVLHYHWLQSTCARTSHTHTITPTRPSYHLVSFANRLMAVVVMCATIMDDPSVMSQPDKNASNFYVTHNVHILQSCHNIWHYIHIFAIIDWLVGEKKSLNIFRRCFMKQIVFAIAQQWSTAKHKIRMPFQESMFRKWFLK